MNINPTNNPNNNKQVNFNYTSRVFSSKVPKINMEENKTTTPINNNNNIIPFRQKSASQNFLNCHCSKKEDLSHCNKLRIKEFVLQEMQNECTINCRNLDKIKILEKQLKDLLESNIYLKKINECLIKNLTRKEELILGVINENKNLKFDNQLLNSHIESKRNTVTPRLYSREKSRRGNSYVGNNISGKINLNYNEAVINGIVNNKVKLNADESDSEFNKKINFEENNFSKSNGFGVASGLGLTNINSKSLNLKKFQNKINNYNNNNENFLQSQNLSTKVNLENITEKEIAKVLFGKNYNKNQNINNKVGKQIFLNEFNGSNFSNINNFDNFRTVKNKSISLKDDFNNKIKYIVDIGNKEKNNQNNKEKEKENKEIFINCIENNEQEDENYRNKRNKNKDNLLNFTNEENNSENKEYLLLKNFKDNNNINANINNENVTSSVTYKCNLKVSNKNSYNSTNELFIDKTCGFEIKNVKNNINILNNENKSLIKYAENNNGNNYLEIDKNDLKTIDNTNDNEKIKNSNSKASNEITPNSHKVKIINNNLYSYGIPELKNDSLVKNHQLMNSPFNFQGKKSILSNQNQKSKNYYEKISVIMRKARQDNNNNKTKEENLISFLSIEKGSLEKLFNNRMFRKIKKLLQSENDFFDKIKNYDEEKLSVYYEMIGSLSDNLHNAINLLIKIKTVFEKILFIPKIETKEFLLSYYIKFITELFDCEKVLIYKYDDFNDKFIIQTGNEEDELNDMRISIGLGILGTVLKNGEIIRIDDANLDPVYLKDRNNEHLNFLKIKNMITAPIKVFYEKKKEEYVPGLKNNMISLDNVRGGIRKSSYNISNNNNTKNNRAPNLNSNKINSNADNQILNKNTINNDKNNDSNLHNENKKIIGMLQLINKKKGHFTNDEEEVVNILTGFFANLWDEIAKTEEEDQHISKLKIFCEFASEVKLIKSQADITLAFETLLISMFSGNCAQLLFYDIEKEELRRITKYENKIKKKNAGIVGYVMDKKEYYGCDSIINCQYFSGSIDLETTNNLLTYPIFHQQKMIAILQFGYNSKLNENKRPKPSDEAMIINVIKSIINWNNFVNDNQIIQKEK